jgi:hypothetical protein
LRVVALLCLPLLVLTACQRTQEAGPASTYVPATATLPPGATPGPGGAAAEVTASLSAADAAALKEYLYWADHKVVYLHEVTQDDAQVAAWVRDDPEAWTDETWLEYAEGGREPDVGKEVLERQDVPEEAADVHRLIVNLAYDVIAVQESYAEGLDSHDVDKLLYAVERRRDINAFARLIASELDRIDRQYGLSTATPTNPPDYTPPPPPPHSP